MCGDGTASGYCWSIVVYVTQCLAIYIFFYQNIMHIFSSVALLCMLSCCNAAKSVAVVFVVLHNLTLNFTHNGIHSLLCL